MKLETIVKTLDFMIESFKYFSTKEEYQNHADLDYWRNNTSSEISGLFHLVRKSWSNCEILQDIDNREFTKLENKYKDILRNQWETEYRRITEMERIRTMEIAAETEEEWSSFNPDEWSEEELATMRH